MNFLDYIILAFVVYFLVKGLFRGFFQEVLGLAGLILALVFATKYMSNVAALIDELINIPPVLTTLLGFLLIFFCIIFATQLLIHTLQKITKYSLLGWMEKLAGGVVGFLKGATILSLLLLFLSMIPFSRNLIPGVKDSQLYAPTRNFAPKLFNLIMAIVPNSKSFYGEVKESLENFSPSEWTKNTQNFLQNFQNDEKSQEKQDTHDQSR